MVLKIAAFKIKISQKRSIYIGLILFLASLSFYVLNLGFAVANASKVTKLEQEIGFLNHKVGEMEAELITYQNEINLDFAYSLGFKETDKVKFIPERSVATLFSNQVQ